LGIPHRLWNDVLVPDRFKKFRDLPKFSVCQNLLQISLGEQHLIFRIVLVWTINDNLVRPQIFDYLFPNLGSASTVLIKLDSVPPGWYIVLSVQDYFDRDICTAPRC
jgi:hypothetical protein